MAPSEGGTGASPVPRSMETRAARSKQGWGCCAVVELPDQLWCCSLQPVLLFMGVPALRIAVLCSLFRGSLLRETCSKVPALAASVFSCRRY